MMDDQKKRTGILRRQSLERYLKRAIRQSQLRRRGCRLRLQHVRQPKGLRQNRRRGTHQQNLPHGNLRLQIHRRGNLPRLLHHREPRRAESLLQIEVS